MNTLQSAVPVAVGAPGPGALVTAVEEGPSGTCPLVPMEHVPATSFAPNKQPHEGAIRLILLSVLCTAGWAASIVVGHHGDFGPSLHRIGLALHILALVVSFGTILVIDWIGLLWVVGKRKIHEPGLLEAAAKPLIWGGLTLLLASGALIHPELASVPTRIKLLCVLVLMLNGLWIAPVMRRVLALPPDTRFGAVGRRLRFRLMIALSISQTCWWCAVLIGLLNSTIRRWAGS